MNAISVRNLTKTFGKKRALDNVNLDIARGEMVALIGASGSGKSTLMRHICGLEIAQAGLGRVEVLGQSIQSGGRLARDARGLRRSIGVVFQQFNLVARLSALSNVLLGNLGRMPTWRGTLGLFTAIQRLKAVHARIADHLVCTGAAALDLLHADLERPPIDVGQHGRGPHEHDQVERRREGHRGGDDLVPRADPVG